MIVDTMFSIAKPSAEEKDETIAEKKDETIAEMINEVKPRGVIRIFEGNLGEPGCILSGPKTQKALRMVAAPDEVALESYEEGMHLTDIGNYSAALEEFQRAIKTVENRKLFDITHESYRTEIEKMWAGLWNNVGFCYLQTGDYSLAGYALLNALAIYPELIYANNNLGEAYEKLGLRDEALFHYKKELELNPEHQAAREACERLNNV